MSRASFLLSGLALLSVGYQTVARRWDAGTPPAVAVTAPAALDVNHEPVPAKPVALSSSVLAVKDAVKDGAMALVPRVQDNLKKGLAALRIKRLVVTQSVEDREPVEVTEVVDAEAPVIAFVEIASGSPDDQHVVITFEHEEGERVGLVNLSVPGNKPRWRTWGRTSDLKRDGRWTAVVRDSRGEELGRTEFTVRGTS